MIKVEQDRLEQTLRLFSELHIEREKAGTLDSESKRNTDNLDIFEAMIRASHRGVTLCVAGHHIMFMRDGIPLPSEFASADTLIFDHLIAKAVWGDNYKEVLSALASEPAAARDALLRQLYESRGQ